MSTPHVLLTAAVQPASKVSVQLNDPEARLAQYRDAFAWWAAESVRHGFGLIVAENSGADRDSYADVFAAVPQDRLRFHTPVPGEDTGRGKGALEAALVEGAVRASGLPDGDAVYKVTGRLTVANPGLVFRPLQENVLVARGLLDNTRIDMRCMGATVGVWTGPLAGLASDVDERRGADLGNALAARALTGEVAGTIDRRRFEVRPQVRGISGTYGRKYGHLINRVSERFGATLERQLVRLAHTKSA